MKRRTFLHRLLLAAGLVAAAALLGSCIRSTVTFRRDGSGVLALEYRIPRTLTDLGGIEADVPFALSEEDFRIAVNGANGLRLRRFVEKVDENDVVIQTKIAFESVETLAGLEGFGDMPMSLEKRGGEMVFQQRIAEAAAFADADLLEPLFEGYELSFTVAAPAAIASHNLGTLSKNGRKVTFVLPLLELVGRRDPLVLTVKWSL